MLFVTVTSFSLSMTTEPGTSRKSAKFGCCYHVISNTVYDSYKSRKKLLLPSFYFIFVKRVRCSPHCDLCSWDNIETTNSQESPIQSRAFSCRARLTAFTALDIIESLLLIIPQYDNWGRCNWKALKGESLKSFRSNDGDLNLPPKIKFDL